MTKFSSNQPVNFDSRSKFSETGPKALLTVDDTTIMVQCTVMFLHKLRIS